MPRSANDPLRTFTAFANPSTATDTVVVAGQANRSIIVHAVFTVAAAANSVLFKSAANVITSTSALAANGGLVLPFDSQGWFKTNVGESLVFTTTAAVATGVTVVYSWE